MTATATQTEITEAITAAYWTIRGTKTNEWVALAELRPALKAYSRDAVDAGLKAVSRAGQGGHLIPIANMKSLTQADRDAALMLGGENQNAIAIDGRAPAAQPVAPAARPVYVGRHRGPQGR